MIYADIVERMIQGALRVRPDVSRAMLTHAADAAFFQLSRQVSEEFAGRENYRTVMRRTFALTFVGGTATLSELVLKKYLMDARLSVAVAVGDPPLVFDYIDSADYARTRDPRLGKWKVEALNITAELPADSEDGAIALVGSASLNCVACPDMPATPSNEYAGLPDMVPELIDAGIQFLLGQTANKAADESTKAA